MKGSEVLYALENGKRISNSDWPDGHYWELENGTVKSYGDGKIQTPGYSVNDLYCWGKWFVVPKYVSFSEAMKAIEEGKNVVCHFKDEKITIHSYNNKIAQICKGKSCQYGGGASILIAWIVAGKWMIEEVEE